MKCTAILLLLLCGCHEAHAPDCDTHAQFYDEGTALDCKAQPPAR